MATMNETRQAAFPQPYPATVIAYNPHWQRPIIPVFAGITGWPAVEDHGFTRWGAQPGAVLLGMWEYEYDRDWMPSGRSEDEIAASGAPRLEVVLPLVEYGELLLDLVALDGGTLAVLDFFDDESGPAEWVSRELDTVGLSEAIREAGSYGRE